MGQFVITEVCGLAPERDETRRVFETSRELRTFLKEMSLEFSDSLADVKHEYPNHELNSLGPEYLGVGFVATIQNTSGAQLSVGVAPENWALVTDDGIGLPPYDVTLRGKLVFYFGEWTEFPASGTYSPATAWSHVENWLHFGKFV